MDLIQLVGTWRLVSFVARDPDGGESDTYGAEPRGVLMYDLGGRMSVHIARASRDALADALEGYFGYFGRYSVDASAGIVTHHVEGASHPDFAGTDQRRLFTLQDERLVLSTAPDQSDGPAITYVATWQRQLQVTPSPIACR